jgi:NAD(P)-dependent dehydrogenase (short-subunit alcohol dehydrogenase family)
VAAYGQAKTADVLFAVEMPRRWAQDCITANALMLARSTPTGNTTPAGAAAAPSRQN